MADSDRRMKQSHCCNRRSFDRTCQRCSIFRIEPVLFIQYILDMKNMSKTSPDEDQRRFIDDLASLLMPWGMPHNAARLYGYLLLNDEPASLDQIAADLEVSKSNASIAARLLEQHGNARRLSERGSKRVLYAAPDNYAGPFINKSLLLGDITKLLQTRVTSVASGNAALRLGEMAQFYLSMRQAMESVIESLNTSAGNRTK